MRITRLEKILLGLALGIAISTGAYAADDDSMSYIYDDTTGKVTITWDDYTGKVTDKTADSFTYIYDNGEVTTTFKDENGNTISYHTAEVGTAGSGSDSFNLASTLGNGTGSGSDKILTKTVTINGTEYTFTVNYSTDGLTQNTSGITNAQAGTSYGDVSGYFENIQVSTDSSNRYVAQAIYNGNTSTYGTIGTVTAGFISCGSGTTANTDEVRGGAINNAAASSLITEIKESYFIGNNAYSSSSALGGAVHNRGKLGSSVTDSAITESYFINNVAENSSSSLSTSINAEGGAIYNNSSGTIGIISGSYFIGNSAKSTGTSTTISAYGGAIYNNGGTMGDITTSYFIGNTAESTNASAYGGAIYNSVGTIGSIKGNFFIANNSKNGGGAIYNYASTIGDITGTYFLANDASGGAAIYNSGSSSTTATIGSISGSYFVGNNSTAGGGAIYSNGYGTIEAITGSYFLGNDALNGGAINNDGGTMVIGGTGTGDGVYFANNTATPTEDEKTDDIVGGAGGAINNAGDMSITGSYFVENEAANGGAIINSASGKTVTIEDSYFLYNTATNANGRGAAIYNDNNAYITSITGSYFIGNEAMSYGGAIYNQRGSSIGSIEDSYFIENKSLAEVDSGKGNGGAIENAWGDTAIGSITRSYFIANEAVGDEEDQSYNGGAIYNEGLIGYYDENDDAAGGISDSDFVANLATRGGAIYNASGTMDGEATTATITSITGSNFLGNTAILYGGAIYNGDGCEIGEISGNYFVDNQAQGGNGGAVENAWGASVIGDMDSNVFIGNKAEGGHSGAAIYNEGLIGIDTDGNTTGGISDSVFLENEASLYGGAIYNTFGTDSLTGEDTTATITYVTDSTFEGNTATSGGAIYNAEGCTIGEISGNSFSSNGAVNEDEDGIAAGGAIYNAGTITTFSVAADITDNYATGTTGAYGGAIFDSSSTITITGDVSGNSATASDGVAAGGAIYYGVANSTSFFAADDTNADSPTITISGDVTSNKASGTTAYGGAIYNDGGTVTLTGNIAENTATGDKAYGGAIYNNSGTVNIDLTNGEVITGNTASSDGGAIYNAGTGTVNINVSGNVVISGNEASDEANFLYGEANSETNFYLADGATLEVDDSIEGDKGYAVNVIGDDISTTTFYMFNDFLDSDLSFSTTTLNTIDGTVKTYSVDKFTVAGDFNMVADVDLGGVYSDDGQPAMDHFETTNGRTSGGSGTYGDNSSGYTLTVTGMNLISDTTSNSAAVYFAETGLMADVASTVSTIGKDSGNGYQTTVYSPIYSYDVHYVYKGTDGIHYGDTVYDIEGTDSGRLLTSEYEDGGYFVFNITGENIDPGTSGGTSGGGDGSTGGGDGSTGGGGGDGGDEGDGGDGGDDGDNPIYSGNSGGTGGDRLENYNPAVLAPEIAMAGVYRAMNMMFEYNFEHSDYYMKLPEEVRLAKKDEKQAEPVESDPTKPEYYNRHELTETAGWFRAFASNESVEYQQGFESRDKYYGGMFGFDTKMNIHDNGWASVFTGYAGTLGIRQQYSGGHIKQHGGFLGATASFYKKNFYTAWTIAGGTMKAHEHTMYGKDKERIDNYGVAARLGYNFEFGDGKFSLLPTFTASYSYIHPEDFTNSVDVHYTGSGLRAVQLNPNLKFIWNRDDGLQPYLTVGEVWTVAESSHITATWAGQSHKLVSLDLRPYTEYGIGVQKRWADEADMYLQVLGHSHSRDGILVSGGFRVNF